MAKKKLNHKIHLSIVGIVILSVFVLALFYSVNDTTSEVLVEDPVTGELLVVQVDEGGNLVGDAKRAFVKRSSRSSGIRISDKIAEAPEPPLEPIPITCKCGGNCEVDTDTSESCDDACNVCKK